MIDLVTCFRGSVWSELGILIHQHVSGLAPTDNADRWHVQGILKLGTCSTGAKSEEGSCDSLG